MESLASLTGRRLILAIALAFVIGAIVALSILDQTHTIAAAVLIMVGTAMTAREFSHKKSR